MLLRTWRRYSRRALAAVLTVLALLLGGDWASQRLGLPGYLPNAITNSWAHNRTPQSCIVTQVSDGDTLQARCTAASGKPVLHKVRLRAIDAPELRQAYGQQARQALTRLCHKARFTLPPKPRTDQYGRLLLNLQCDGVDVGSRMVGSGMAWVYHHEAKGHPELVALQEQARRSRQGLWGQANPQPPWEWRKQNPR